MFPGWWEVASGVNFVVNVKGSGPRCIKQFKVRVSCPGDFLFILLMAVSSSTMVNGSYALCNSWSEEGVVCIVFSVQALLTRISGLWAGGSGSFLFL